MSDTVTVYHPNPDVTTPAGGVVSYEVSKDDVEKWVKQGWLKSAPKGAKGAADAE